MSARRCTCSPRIWVSRKELVFGCWGGRRGRSSGGARWWWRSSGSWRQATSSVRLVEDRGDRSRDGGLLQPALQPLRILLGQDPLVDSVRHCNAAYPKSGQQVARRLLGASLGASLGAPLGAPLRDILFREIALVFVALHHRLQCTASRL